MNNNIKLPNKPILLPQKLSPKILIRKNLKRVHPEMLKHLTTLYKEDVIYESTPGDFLKLDTRLTLLNKFNVLSNSCLTVARLGDGPDYIEKTSENITRVIGQSNYDILFSSLCSVLNYELKVRGILALLTVPTPPPTTSATAGHDRMTLGGDKKHVEDKSNQTEETCLSLFMMDRPRKRSRRPRPQPSPYVVTNDLKALRKVRKIVVNPEKFKDFTDDPCQSKLSQSKSHELTKLEADPLAVDSTTGSSPLAAVKKENKTVPQTKSVDSEEDTKDSLYPAESVSSWPDLLQNQMAERVQDIESVTKAGPITAQTLFDLKNTYTLTLLDGTKIEVPVRIPDHFHIATPELIKLIRPEQRLKVLCYQAYIDWKFCLAQDNEGHFPIHVAAMNGDVDMLRRQCVVVKMRNESVDLLTQDNLSALQIAIYGDHSQCTEMLLRFGADPLICDEEYRNCFHLAAEAEPEHLRAIMNHYQTNALTILRNNKKMWRPEMAEERPDVLAKNLLIKVCTTFDNQGYTPLMLACKMGNYRNVGTLLGMVPEVTNIRMPNSGNTALYLAVSSACLDYGQRANTVSDEFKITIELLMDHGANPAIENHSGSSVNSMLSDMKIGELSMLVANKLTRINCWNSNLRTNTNASNVMLVRQEDGTTKVEGVTIEDTQPDQPAQDDIKPDIKKYDQVVKLETAAGLPMSGGRVMYSTLAGQSNLPGEAVVSSTLAGQPTSGGSVMSAGQPKPPSGPVILSTLAGQPIPPGSVLYSPLSDQPTPPGSVVYASLGGNTNRPGGKPNPPGSVIYSSISRQPTPGGSVIYTSVAGQPTPSGSVIYTSLASQSNLPGSIIYTSLAGQSTPGSTVTSIAGHSGTAQADHLIPVSSTVALLAAPRRASVTLLAAPAGSTATGGSAAPPDSVFADPASVYADYPAPGGSVVNALPRGRLRRTLVTLPAAQTAGAGPVVLGGQRATRLMVRPYKKNKVSIIDQKLLVTSPSDVKPDTVASTTAMVNQEPGEVASNSPQTMALKPIRTMTPVIVNCPKNIRLAQSPLGDTKPILIVPDTPSHTLVMTRKGAVVKTQPAFKRALKQNGKGSRKRMKTIDLT